MWKTTHTALTVHLSFFFLITAIDSESEIWCKILYNLDTEKTTTWQIPIAFDQRSLSREELSMLMRSIFHPAHLPSLLNSDQHPQLLVSQMWAEGCLVEVTAHQYVMLKGASEASGKLYNRTFKVTSLNHTYCSNSWVIQSVGWIFTNYHFIPNAALGFNFIFEEEKKSGTLFLTAGTMIETVPKHLLLQFHLSFIPLLSSTFSTLQPPPFSSSAHCPLCLYLLSDFCSLSPLWASQWLQPQVHLTFLPRLRTAWRKAHCNTDHFQNLLQAQTIPPRLASLLRKYVSVQK